MSNSASAGKWAWHIHHTQLVERASNGGLEERAKYISYGKPKRERARRLRLMKLVEAQDFMTALQTAINSRPATGTMGLRRKLRLAIQRVITLLHDYECKKCPWDGETIFPKKVKK